MAHDTTLPLSPRSGNWKRLQWSVIKYITYLTPSVTNNGIIEKKSNQNIMNLHYMAADAVTQRYHISCEIMTNQPCKICRDANINHTFRAIQNSDCFEEDIIILSYLRKV